MNIVLGFIIAIINFILLNKDEKKGIVVFVILTIVCPNSLIGSLYLSYSYIFFPFLIYWYFFIKKGTSSGNSYLAPLFIWFLWLLVVTFILSSLSADYPVNVPPIIGTLKFLIVLSIVSKLSVIKDSFYDILRCVIVINCIAMAFELYLVNMIGPVSTMTLWEHLWGTTGGEGIRVAEAEEMGVFRLYGTFTTSAFPATLSMVGIALFWSEMRTKNTWLSFFSLIASLLCGIGATSKRFFLGGTLFFLISFFLTMMLRNKNRHNGISKTGLLICVVAVLAPILYAGLKDVLAIDAYMEYLIKGDLSGSMDTRFGDEGVVNSMIPYIHKYFLTGVGEVIIPNVVVTDSYFYILLYKTGLIGLVFFIFFFLRIIIRVVHLRIISCYIVLGVIIFEFFISTEFISDLGLYFESFILYCCSMRNVNKKHILI